MRQKHMGELVPRSYLWLEKLVADRCKELRDGEGGGDKDDNNAKEGSGGSGSARGKKEKDRDSKDRDSFSNRSSFDLAATLEGVEGKGKGIPTIPWSQFVSLGQICTIKVFIALSRKQCN